jgi:hypothetical protein
MRTSKARMVNSEQIKDLIRVPNKSKYFKDSGPYS